MPKRDEYRRRLFLNDGQGMAAIEAYARIAEYSGGPSIEAGFELRDCTRSAEIDFSIGDAEDAAKIRAKINRLYREVRSFKDAVLTRLDEIEHTLK